MNKILVLRFKDAQDFPYPDDTSDRIYESFHTRGGYPARNSVKRLSVNPDTLHVRHVANLLHVLMGEKPVPKNRKCFQYMDQSIYELSKNALVKITNFVVEETKTSRKALQNANSKSSMLIFLDGKWLKMPGGEIYYSKLERHLGEKAYNKFLYVASKLNGGTLPLTAKKSIEILNKNKNDTDVKEFLSYLKEIRRSSLCNLIVDGEKCASVNWSDNRANRGDYISLVTNSGPEKINCFSGFIYVPVNEMFLSRLQRGSGVGTLLDGGVVFIDGVVENSELATINAKPVETKE